MSNTKHSPLAGKSIAGIIDDNSVSSESVKEFADEFFKIKGASGDSAQVLVIPSDVLTKRRAKQEEGPSSSGSSNPSPK